MRSWLLRNLEQFTPKGMTVAFQPFLGVGVAVEDLQASKEDGEEVTFIWVVLHLPGCRVGVIF